MPFNDLPVELLDQIAHHIDHDTQSLRSFTRTCKHAHGVLNHLLYRYIVCKDDRSGAKCCRTLVTCPELCAEVKSFTVLGPDTLSRHNPTWLSLLLAFTRDFTASLRGMTNLEYLNCDIAYCSLEVALTLCEATFDRLHSLVIRFDDTSLSSPLRATNDLHKLEKAHLPGLKRVIVRENAQHIQPSTFVDHIVNSRRDSLHDLMLRSRIHSYTSLWRRAPPPIWASLETLSICRAMFDANVLAEMPQIRSFTILQDFEAIQDSISSQILPKLQHLGCQPLNVAAFLPLNLPELGRPIRSVHFNGASSRGGYDSTSAPPSLRHILLGIAHLRFSSDVVEELNIGVSWHDLHGLVDGAVLSLLHPVKHLTLVIIDGRRGLVRCHVYSSRLDVCANLTWSIAFLGARCHFPDEPPNHISISRLDLPTCAIETAKSSVPQWRCTKHAR